MLEDFGRLYWELFISVDKAREQAEEYGHSLSGDGLFGFRISTAMIIIRRKKKQKCLVYRKKFLTAYGLTRK